MRRFFPLVILVVTLVMRVSAQSPIYFSSGDYLTPNSWDQGSATLMNTIVGTNIHITNANGAGNKYFRFYSLLSGGTRYEPSGASDILLTANASVTLQSNGSNKAYFLNISDAASNVIFKTNSSAKVVAFEVQGPIQSATTVTQSPVATGVLTADAVTINATLSGPLATGQGVYLRYTKNGYSSSIVVPMTGSGINYSAVIPAAVNTEHSNISYYVFTSGNSGPAADGSDADLFTINLNNNGGPNYTYKVNTPGVLWTNPITATDPSIANPFTLGDVFNSNITVSGIGRGTGISGNAAGNRYNAIGWNSANLDLNDYFEFSLTSKAGMQINFISFVYTGQRSNASISNFAFRSSIDNFTSNIGSPTFGGTTIDLSAATYQNVTSSITFRFYAWGADMSSRTFSINDFTFNGTVTAACTPPTITQQPADQSLCINTSGSLTAASSAPGATFQWQMSANGTNGWSNVNDGTPSGVSYSNAATGTLDIAATTAVSEYFYRCVIIANSCAAYSNVVKLVVNDPPAVTAPVDPAAVCGSFGGTVSPTVSGSNLVYQWQYSADGNGWADVINNIPNNGATYTNATAKNLGIDGLTQNAFYRLALSNGGCMAANSTATNVIVKTLPANPAGSVSGASPACNSTLLTYNNAGPSFYWQTSATGTDDTNPTTSPYVVNASGTYYVRQFDGSCWSAAAVASQAIIIETVPPTITNDPANASVEAGTGTTFSVSGITGSFTGLQWQQSDDGGSSWSPVAGGIFSGETTQVLGISNVTGLTGNQYRVLVTGPCGTATSGAGILTVYTSSFLWTNPITGTNPNLDDPYITGQSVKPNITVSGVGRGININSLNTNDRYNASGWNVSAPTNSRYFYFTLTPTLGYKIDFANFVYSSQASSIGPTNFSVRSSKDNFGNNIATLSSTGGAISLNGTSFQNVTSAITFRVYAWGASQSEGTFSINDFTFNGIISPDCTLPVATKANNNVTAQVFNVNPTCFTANWNTVAGATGYYLDVSEHSTFSTPAPQSSDLFISEYVEGSGNNKYIEIYNGTGTTVNLSDYRLQRYANGAVSPTEDVLLTGTITNGGTVVLKNTAATLYVGAATINAAVNFNGNDAVALYKTSTAKNVDIIGSIGEDPGTEWQFGGLSTRDRTLMRKASVTGGVTVNPASGFPTLALEWDQYARDDVSHLGAHSTSAPSFVAGYNNLFINDPNATTINVSGLDTGKVYYYRVRSANTCGSSVNSNVVNVKTTVDYANYRSRTTGNYSDASTWQVDMGCSGGWVAATQAPGPNNNVNIRSGHQVIINASASVATGRTLLVENGGYIIFNTSTNNVTGAGNFTLSAGSTIFVASVDGITASGSTGNVRTTTRNFDVGANYVYRGSANQNTGNGLPASVNTFTVLCGGILTYSSPNPVLTITSPSNSLNLNFGLFSLGAGNTISIPNGGVVTSTGGNLDTGPSGGTISFEGSGSVTGSVNFNKVCIKNGVDFGTGSTINNLLQINTGGFVSNNHPPTYGSNSTLLYNTGGVYVRNSEWSAASGVGFPYHVRLSNNTTIDAGGTSFTTTPLNSGGDVTIDAGSALYMDYSGHNMQLDLNIGGNLNVDGNLSATNVADKDIYVKGSYTNNGTTANINMINAALRFNGSTIQILSGSNSTANGFTLPYLNIENTGSGSISLQHDLTVTNVLALTKGIVTPGAGVELKLTNTAPSAITGGSSTSFINGPLNWQLPANLIGPSVYLFPVGKGATYLPFTVNNITTGSAAPLLQVEAFNTGSGGTADGTTISSLSTTEHWKTGLLSGNVVDTRVSLGRQTTVGTLNAIAFSTTQGGPYSNLGGSAAGSNINFSNVTGNLGYFTMASAVPAPVITSFTPSGYTGSVITINGSSFTNVSAVTINGVAATSFTYVSATQLTATVGVGLPATGVVTITTPAGTASLGTFTYLGYITKANGTFTNNISWLGDNVPPANAAITIAHTTTVVNNVGTSYDKLTVQVGGNLDFAAAGALNISTTFVQTGGAVNMTNGGALNMGGNSNFTFTAGTFTSGSGLVNFTGDINTTATVNGNPVFNNVTTTGGVDFVNNASIKGTFLLNMQAFVINHAPTYLPGSLLQYNTGNTYKRTVEWNNPANVLISSNTILDASGDGGSTAAPFNMTGDLTIATGSALYMDFNNKNMTVPLRVAGSVTISGALSLSKAVGGDMEVGGDWTNTGAFAANDRLVTFNGSTGDQTVTKAGGETFDFLTIDKTIGNLVLANNLTTKKTLAINNGNLQIGSNLLTINGPLAASIGNGFTGSKTSDLVLGSGFSGTLYFNNNIAEGNYLNRLNLNASATLGDSLNIAPCRFDNFTSTGTLIVNGNAQLITNDKLVLVSDETGTARIAKNTSGSNYIIGKVTVQRFIPKKRAWRLVTAPISGNLTINKAWQEGLVYSSATGKSYLAGTQTEASPPAGWYGLHITGGSTLFASAPAANAVGFDYGVTSGSPSIRIFQNNSWSQTLPQAQGTLYTNIKDYPAYMLFGRGDRTIDPVNTNPATATDAVIRASSSIAQNNQVIALPANQGLAVVGNPFPSPISFESLYTNNTDNIEDKFFVWDATLNVFGGYRLVRRTATNTYVTVPYNKDGTPLNSETASTDYQHIQSGQGFFVLPKANATSITIREADKSENTKTNVFNSENRPSINVNMYLVHSQSATQLADGVMAIFDNAFSAAIDRQDVAKPNNFNENLGIRRGNAILMLEARPLLVQPDTLWLNLANVTNRNYQFIITGGNFVRAGLSARLIDSYLNSSTFINLDGSAVTVEFTVTANAASKKADRFMIVFEEAAVLPLNFTRLTAVEKGTSVLVDWQVHEEDNLLLYKIERSADGVVFEQIGERAVNRPSTSGSYSWLDHSPVPGTNFYRIKAVDRSGGYAYSTIAQVRVDNISGAIQVYPNPVTSTSFAVEFLRQAAGRYQVMLYDAAGKTILKKIFDHIGGNALMKISTESKLAAGIYRLQVTGSKGTVIQTLICK